jgi:hypothetical protein
MSTPVLLQDAFTRMVRDKPRDQLPRDAAHNIQDYIPDQLGVALRKRGGWEYHGATLNSLNASAGQPSKVGVAPFAAGTQVIAFDSSLNRLFDLTNGADRGAAQNPAPPAFYRELFIFGKSDAAAAPMKYTGSGAPATLGGSPPNMGSLAVYKNLLCGVGFSGSVLSRIYFSGESNPESWNTTIGYIDASRSIRGIAALPNALLILEDQGLERIRGDVPPGTAAFNMELEPVASDVGCHSADAFAVYNDKCYFADEDGVYETDGAQVRDLTKEGGLSNFYRTQFASVGASGRVALGVWRGFLWLSLQGSSDAFVDLLVCEIKTRAWLRFTNIRAYNFANQFGSTDELYFSNRDTSSKKIGKLSAIFNPVAGVKNDADGDAVTPVLETSFYALGSQYRKRWRHVYVSYDVRDAASDNPALTVSYLTSPEATSYTALSPTLPETTVRTRVRRAIGTTPSYGIALKIAQSNASSDTRGYSLEADVRPLEGSRR